MTWMGWLQETRMRRFEEAVRELDGAAPDAGGGYGAAWYARARCGATSTGTTRAARRADRQANGADVVAAGAGGLGTVPGEVRADVGVPRPAPPLPLRSRRLAGRHRVSAGKTLRAFRGLCPESPKYIDTGAKRGGNGLSGVVAALACAIVRPIRFWVRCRGP